MRNENPFNEQVVSTVTSSATSLQALENKVRYMLDQLAAQTSGWMPHGMVLEGRISLDHHGNKSLYVFLRLGEEAFTGRSGVGNEGPRIPDAVGGKWISLNRDDFDPAWEARDLIAAIRNWKAAKAGV